MSPAAKKTSSLERKLRELEAEEERVRKELKALSKALKKGEVPPVSASARRLPSPPMSTPAQDNAADPSSVEKVQKKPAAPATIQPLEKIDPARDGDLFAWPDAVESTPKSTSKPRTLKQKHKVHQDERFASYFTTGGFKSTVPLRQERRVQRNRALLMLAVIIVFGYILASLLR